MAIFDMDQAHGFDRLVGHGVRRQLAYAALPCTASWFRFRFAPRLDG